MMKPTQAQLDAHDAAMRRMFTPPDRAPVSVWAERHLYLPAPQTQSPGYVLWTGRDYLREPLDSWNDWSVSDLVCCFGSQTGKTTMIMAGAAWCVDQDPGAVLWVMPNETLAQSFSENRWRPVLESSPKLAARIPTGRDRHGYKVLEQRLAGSLVTFVGSNSPANLASRPAKTVILDEVDKFSSGTAEEADAVNLAEQRTKSFANPRRIKCSTPTVISGLIWQEFLKGDQRRFFVPCPHCGKHVLFAWSPKHTSFAITGAESFVKWDQSAKQADGSWDLNRVTSTAHAECPHCKGAILDHHKTAMLAAGEWRATATGKAGFRSYHLSSLYAATPETTFGRMAVRFLQAKKSLLGLQGFINGDLAEPWAEQPDERATVEVQSDYSLGDVWDQEEARFLTVDVQQSEFWAVVRQWSKDGASRLFWTGRLQTWGEVRDLQVRLAIRSEFVFVDASHYSDTVYKECCQHDWNAVKGERAVGGFSEPIPGGRSVRVPVTRANGPATPTALHPGSVVTACELLRISEDMTAECLQRLRSGETHSWTIAKDTPQEYRIQIASRVRRPRANKRTGKVEHEWKTIGTHGEHLWDCERYQIAAAYLAGVLSIQPEPEPTKEK